MSIQEQHKTKVYYSIVNAGDGSVYLNWFLTMADAEYDQGSDPEGWGETCVGSAQTYKGSDIHKEAIKNSEIMKFKKEVEGLSEDEADSYFSSINRKHQVVMRDGKSTAETWNLGDIHLEIKDGKVSIWD